MGSFARARMRKERKAINKGYDKAKKQNKVVRRDMARTYAEQIKADIQCRRDAISNLSAIFMLTVHERYGFGRRRILRLRDKMQREFDAITSGNVNVREIDHFLMDELKLDAGLSRKYTSANHYEGIEDRVVRELTAAFLMAMLDEFGYKGNALAKTCRHAFAINDRLNKNELTYPQIRARLQKVMDRGRKDDDVCLDKKSRK